VTPADIKDRVRQDTDAFATSIGSVADFETNYFHDYFRRMPFAVMQRTLAGAGVDWNGQSIHLAGCGVGLDLFHLSRLYRDVDWFVSDISDAAVASTLRRFPGVRGQAEDMERLSFADDAFDWSFVAAAIHHLPRPALGVYELLRVSRKGIVLIEPNDSWMTRLFVSLGLAQEYEDVGNYVYRWSRNEIVKLCRSLYFDCRCTRMFATHRVAKSRLEFEAWRALHFAANSLIPGSGNYIICCIEKDAARRAARA
jgi:SAM-dependent methyltransferase